MNKNKSLGDRLRNYRKKNDMTQEELGKLLYVGRQSISAYERESRLPNIYLLSDLADIYGITVDELIGRK